MSTLSDDSQDRATSKAPTHTWRDFKNYVDQLIDAGRVLLFRGQSRASWGLVSSYHRLAAPLPADIYWKNALPFLHDYIRTSTGLSWNLSVDIERQAFLGFLQHNGFPTPLLDWTRSPYAAAYFAFEGAQKATPKAEHVAIFAFDSLRWRAEWAQVYDPETPGNHVSVLHAAAHGNQKQLLQQGVYTYSSVINQELHIYEAEREMQARDSTHPGYLEKFTFSVAETPLVLKDLDLMGVTAMALDPSIAGVCKHLRETLFRVSTMDQNAQTEEMLANLRRLTEQTRLPRSTGLPGSQTTLHASESGDEGDATAR